MLGIFIVSAVLEVDAPRPPPTPVKRARRGSVKRERCFPPLPSRVRTGHDRERAPRRSARLGHFFVRHRQVFVAHTARAAGVYSTRLPSSWRTSCDAPVPDVLVDHAAGVVQPNGYSTTLPSPWRTRCSAAGAGCAHRTPSGPYSTRLPSLAWSSRRYCPLRDTRC